MSQILKMDKRLRWPLLAVALLSTAVGVGLAMTHSREHDAFRVAPELEGQAALPATTSMASTAQQLASRFKPSVVPRLPESAEGKLLAVIGLIEQQRLDEALEAAARLTADLPNFQAAQLVYADLLRFKSGARSGAKSEVIASPPRTEGTMLVSHHGSPGAETESPAWQQQLRGLREELSRRVQAAGPLPPAGSIPGEFLVLEPSVRHAIAVDASKSRLYLFSHENGKLRLLADFYVSIGKLGMDKRVEGDQRTPQGMYFVGRRIPGAKLPHLYGKGALTLNYPNDWDRAVGRGGSGIWLHGAPPDQFARLPEASDGCIVLANPDMLQVMNTIEGRTPVLVRDQLEWVAPEEVHQRQALEGFEPVLEAWRQGWSDADARAQAGVYSPALNAAPKAAQRRLATAFKTGDASLQDVSVYAWKDEEGEIRIVNLKVKGGALAQPLSLRQYWRKLGDQWQLFSEDILS